MSDQKECSVLIVEDDSWSRLALQRLLVQLNCQVVGVESVAAARTALAARRFDLMLADYSLPDGDAPDLIRSALAADRARAVYVITGNAHCANVVAAMRAGAVDVMEKPFRVETVMRIVETNRGIGDESIRDWCARLSIPMIGEDDRTVELLRIIRRVANSPSTVLITGESGTGKELIAQALHLGSRRAAKPMVALNCAAIPESLIESELFGHVRGAFTGADRAREGKITAANGGVLFLDEVGELPLLAQAKLLRVLQDSRVTPVGSNLPITIDVRVVAATNQNLDQLVEEGKFREDLYYRLNVVRIEPWPLRERKRDIVPLARHFLQRASQAHGTDVVALSPDAEETLAAHDWPGNVRELSNVIECAVAMNDGGTITSASLRLQWRRKTPVSMRAVSLPVQLDIPANNTIELAPPAEVIVPLSEAETLNLRAALDDVEKKLIEKALARAEGNRTEAAALLGLNRTTLVEKIRKFGT